MSTFPPIAVVGQTLKVRARFDADLTGASSILIKYKPPGAAEGNIPGTLESVTDGKSIVTAKLTPAILATVGDWSIWGDAVDAEGDTVLTYGVLLKVVSKGTVIS
jgi:hypothetical protein